MSRDSNDHFETTRWSLVERSGAQTLESQAALEELCRRSWFPIYAFIRRGGASAHDAEDLAQGFFQHVLAQNLISRARSDLGRFRSFLLSCLKHYLGNEWQKSHTLKRGGKVRFIYMESLTAEERYQLESENLGTDDADVFDQAWAHDILQMAMAQLRSEQKDQALFNVLAPTLTGREDRHAMEAATGISEGTLKVAIHRLRKRYREILRATVRDTVGSESEVDAELAYLAACLRR